MKCLKKNVVDDENLVGKTNANEQTIKKKKKSSQASLMCLLSSGLVLFFFSYYIYVAYHDTNFFSSQIQFFTIQLHTFAVLLFKFSVILCVQIFYIFLPANGKQFFFLNCNKNNNYYYWTLHTLFQQHKWIFVLFLFIFLLILNQQYLCKFLLQF